MMKTLSAKELALLTAGLVLATITMDAVADNTGYLTDSRGVVVRSETGQCWHTSVWTPEHANAECDPTLVPQRVAFAAPEPAAFVAPVSAAPTERLSLAAETLFDFDKAELKPEGKARIDEIVRMLNEGGAELGVIASTGHTDSIGSDEYNLQLSERRAEAVKDYLVSQGIDANRIRTEGMGERQPVADNTTSEGRAENRHVLIEVEALRTQG